MRRVQPRPGSFKEGVGSKGSVMMSNPPRGWSCRRGRRSGQPYRRFAEMASRRPADAPSDLESEAARPGPRSAELAAFFGLDERMGVQLSTSTRKISSLKLKGSTANTSDRRSSQRLMMPAGVASSQAIRREEFIADLFSELNFLLSVDALGAVQRFFEDIGEIFDVSVFKLHPVPGWRSMVAAFNRVCSDNDCILHEAGVQSKESAAATGSSVCPGRGARAIGRTAGIEFKTAGGACRSA